MAFADDRALINSRVEALISQAAGFLIALQNAASPLIVEGTTVLPESYDYASVPQVSFPTFGAVGTLGTISSDAPPSLPDPSVIQPDAISVPDFLSSDLIVPTTVFEFQEAAYQSVLLDPLKAKLLDNLLNGGYGIETADEVALFNRSRDREIEAALSRIDDAGRAMAARGFPLPPGELSIHVDRAYQDMQNKVSGASRDITLERSKLFVDNRQFTIREVRDIEQVLIGFHNSVQERAYNVSRASVELGIALYNTLLARFRLRLDAAKIKSDVQSQTLQLLVEQARTRFDGFRAQIAAYEADVRRQIESAKLPIEFFRANIDNARVLNDGRISQATLQQKVLESTTQQNIQISAMTIENAKARIQGVTNSLHFKTKAAEFAAAQFVAQLASLESVVNTLSVQTATQ
jgi:hypothetical protein